MRRRTRWLILTVVLTGLTLAGCSSTKSSEQSAAEPASLETIEGSDVARVTLTKDAIERIGLEVKPVQAIGTSTLARTTVPLAAVLYDKDGASWVYTNPSPLTYARQRVVIDHVDGESAVLRSGPPPGTAVVTVGGAELLGTEYVVEGE